MNSHRQPKVRGRRPCQAQAASGCCRIGSGEVRYRLLPPVWDLHRGNAALIYSKLAINMHGKDFDDRQERLDKWLEMPADELPLDELRYRVDWQYFFDDVDLAARCTECDWQLPLGERPLFTLVMPELQSCRAMARLLAGKARLQVAEGNLDAALRTFQDGFALGQHVGAGPTIVHGLVGIAISQVMFKALRDYLEHPKSPNLYWALTTLPSPLIDLRKAADIESAMLYLSYPDLRAIHAGDRTPPRLASHHRSRPRRFGIAATVGRNRAEPIGINGNGLQSVS